MNQTENLLREALKARAERVDMEPATMLEVERKARRLRQRRARVTLLAAAAAVAAIGVPAAWVMTSMTPGPGRDPDPASSGSVLAALPLGAEPRIDYLVGRTYVRADGTRVGLDLDPAAVRDVAPYAGGVLVSTWSSSGAAPGAARQLWFGDDGLVEDQVCGGETFALSSDSLYAARVVLDAGCLRWRAVSLRWDSTSATTPGPLDIVTTNGQRVEPVGVTAEKVLYNAVEDTGGATRSRAFTTSEFGPPIDVPGIAYATAWDPASGRVAGCSTAGRCVVVDELDGTSVLSLEHGETPLSFSPDGRYLVTAGAADGRGSVPVRVRDAASGDIVQAVPGQLQPSGAALVAWEGSERLILPVVDGEDEALVRLGLDGSAELATEPTPTTEGGYLLPAS